MWRECMTLILFMTLLSLCYVSGDSCESLSCSQFCTETSLGPRCFCTEGFELDANDNKTCKDVNECVKGGFCDQLCNNTEGSYECWCHEGFQRMEKGSCRILDSDDDELVFYNEGTSVYFTARIKYRFPTYRLPVSFAMMGITGLSFDADSKILFASSANKPAILSVDVSSLRKRNLVEDGITSPEDIAFDWSSNNLYWIDSGKGTAEVISLDNLRRTVLIEDLSRPIALVLSPRNGVMFIATDDFETPVFMYGMDGRNGRILDSVRGSPVSLSAHPSKSLLYWSDPGEGTISYVNYSSSSSPKTFWRGSLPLRAIAVGERKVHYTFGEPGQPFEKADWINQPGYFKETFDWRSITLGTTKSSGKSECLTENGGCDYLCLTSEHGTSCACSPEMILDRNGKSCLSK